MAQIRITFGFLETTQREGEFGIFAFNIRVWLGKKKDKEEEREEEVEDGNSEEEIPSSSGTTEAEG